MKAASLLRQLSSNPSWAHHLHFITALQSITAGSRDRSLAEDPALHYAEATEILLLIEALETGVRQFENHKHPTKPNINVIKKICYCVSNLFHGTKL